jgi:hypothetical protein
MKKIFTTLLIFSGAYFSASAQTSKGFEFGLNAGLSWATGSNAQTSVAATYKTGFNAGGVGEYFLSDRWSIKAKVSYDQKGWANDFVLFDQNGNAFPPVRVKYKLNYVTVPPWQIGTSGKVETGI